MVHNGINEGCLWGELSNFWIKFEKGEVIDYGAEEGEEVLKNIIRKNITKQTEMDL